MKNKMMVAALLMVMILTGCGNRVPLKTAYEEADLSSYNNHCIEYGDDWSFISIDTNPYDEDYEDCNIHQTMKNVVFDFNQTLGFPQSVEERMLQTTWDQGRQTYKGKEFSVSWTFHPNQGFEVIYEVNNK